MMQLLRQPRTEMNNEMIEKFAPAVFAEQPYGETSSKYSFIPTIRFIDKLRERGWIPVSAQEQRVRLKDRAGFQKHLIRFQHESQLGIDVGTRPEILLTNSHDGKSSFKLMAGIFRIACANGLIVGESMLPSVSIMHTGYTDELVRDASDHMLEGTPRLLGGIKQFQDVPLSEQESRIFAESAAMIRWNNCQAEELPVKPDALLAVRRSEDRESNLWSTFNVVQENLMKGGYRMKPKPAADNTYKRYSRSALLGKKARRIDSINEDVRLNRGLWNLAEKMRELKKGGNQIVAVK